MRRIVLPFVAGIADPVAATDIGAVAATDVGVAVEIVVDIDVDVVASPAAAPAPASAKRRSHCHADTERDRARSNHCACRVRRVVDWWIRIYWRSVHNCWIIAWHVDHFRTCLLHHNYLLALHLLCLYLHLLVRF